jgi:hypothetical protein
MRNIEFINKLDLDKVIINYLKIEKEIVINSKHKKRFVKEISECSLKDDIITFKNYCSKLKSLVINALESD